MTGVTVTTGGTLSIPLKYRPERFQDLVGQDVNATFLATLIKRGPIGKNLILYGPYGSSKTTSCRIYARALNCLQPTPEGEPCNVCEHCRLFYEGRYSDYLEVDGSSKGGKDSIKELVEVARTPPLLGRYRVINIDECQGLSRAAWDTLLKLIEEPPPYLVFIFTTTERDKVREAIRSRCQELEVKLLDPAAATRHLARVSTLEGFSYEPEALDLIAYLAGGHARDLLKHLEQVSYLGEISAENVRSMFNLGYVETTLAFFGALFKGDLPGVGAALAKLQGEGYTGEEAFAFLQEFMAYFHYNVVAGVPLQVSPILAALPKGDYARLYRDLESLTRAGEVPVEGASLALVDFFCQQKVRNWVELDLCGASLVSFVGAQRFRKGTPGVADLERTSTSTRNSGPKGTPSRRFVGSYLGESQHTQPALPSQLPLSPEVPSELPPATPAPGGKVYPHTLAQHHFKQVDKSNTTIVLL